jgi:hypothetical protein
MSAQRTYRPVIVTIPAGEQHTGVYEIHLHRPHKPKVYQRSTMGTLHRVSDGAKLTAVAVWMRRGVDAQKRAHAEMVRRQAGWRFRMGRKIRAWLEKLWSAFRRTPAEDINADLHGPLGV